MGVMTRKVGETFIITSDRAVGELPSKVAPKKRTCEVYQVWTGDAWSATASDAKTFDGIDVADDYVRSHYDQVMS